MRADVAFAMEQFKIERAPACELVDLNRSSYRYEPRPDHNARLRGDRGASAAKNALRVSAFACLA
jgi:hypothetical protein